jgi:hypothetical protein
LSNSTSPVLISFPFLFFFFSNRDWTQGLVHARQVPYHWPLVLGLLFLNWVLYNLGRQSKLSMSGLYHCFITWRHNGGHFPFLIFIKVCKMPLQGCDFIWSMIVFWHLHIQDTFVKLFFIGLIFIEHYYVAVTMLNTWDGTEQKDSLCVPGTYSSVCSWGPSRQPMKCKAGT